jgi:hypothetical protein
LTVVKEKMKVWGILPKIWHSQAFMEDSQHGSDGRRGMRPPAPIWTAFACSDIESISP